ncbi:methyltransferase domain-containing protein [Alcaligenaceae bacterium]|nr:methyltransferase domain-containing protein [Alcaligenaceae bacterium]
MNIAHKPFSLPALSVVESNDFTRAARILHTRAGILLGSHKRDMAERTLGLRAKKVNFATVREYLDLLEQSPHSPEWENFVNAFTINHTAFFREQHHFEILGDFVKTRTKPLSIWCAASSTGEEPYSIAITLQEYCPQPSYGVNIIATDIDTKAIERAKAGVYSMERVKPVPEEQLKKYFQRGVGERAGMVRVKQAVRDMVKFDVLNLLSPTWHSNEKFDAIFCRNTMIYFDKETQTRILERFAQVLKPGGLLFAGHSENFTYLTKAFRLQGQTVYVVSET